MTTLIGRILVADDEESIRWVLQTTLAGDGHSVEQVDNGDAALQKLSQNHFDLALVDIKMPGLDGLELLSKVRDAGLPTPIVIITAQNTMANAIEAMKRGAYDYLTKPFDIEEVRLLVQRVLEMRRQASELTRLEEQTRRRFELGVEIIGTTPAMQEIFKTIGRVAPTDATVLIQGESGTGKELIARAIHSHSPRWSAPFVALNCSAVPRDLLESELFGHERGAFTGATEQRAGMFEVAHGGTLFLDEVGDMPLELQAKLLRVVQERELTRVGGREVLKVDCRLIAATNQDLERAVKQGRFREDLYFRLRVVPITVPPLRQRRGDIPDLVNYFITKINREMSTNITGISPEARAILNAHEWPGNVRELENTLVRAAVLAPGPTLMPRDLALATHEAATITHDDLSLEDVVRLKLKEYFRQTRDVELTNLYPLIMERIERPLIELTLERTQGNQLKAAALLGINRNTLHKKITQLKITPTRRSGDAE
ncbi:MAG: two component, sigma54 specific, transcriptional regulator, Fis family [Deltaproteobacteria bacterium]|jgi:two-component system nitrogen regulation response regulator GlnG|nr:two component, sigma54 specific, transcriptional regulator, Fis family [Deltaproteobacteria bacterium]